MILVKSEYLYDRFLDTDNIQHAYIESSSTHRHVKGTEAEKYWVVVQMTGGSVTLGNDVHSLYKEMAIELHRRIIQAIADYKNSNSPSIQTVNIPLYEEFYTQEERDKRVEISHSKRMEDIKSKAQSTKEPEPSKESGLSSVANWVYTDSKMYNLDCFRKIETYYVGGDNELWGVRGWYTSPDESSEAKEATDPHGTYGEEIGQYWVHFAIAPDPDYADTIVQSLFTWLQAANIDSFDWVSKNKPKTE